MPEPDDMTLVREYAVEKSDAAFEELARRHVNLVYSAALRQVRNPPLAEEITQATFIILARKAATFRAGTILPVWLLRTVGYAARTELRTRLRRQTYETEAQMESMIQQEAVPAPEWEQIAPLLDEALARLGEKERSALVLRYFNEKPFEEVGAALGIDAATARKRVERGLEKLRQNFARRGVALSAGVAAATLSAHAVQAAPAALAASVAAAATLKGATISASTATLIKGALKLMAWTKLKTGVVIGVVALLTAGTATVIVTHQHGDGTAAGGGGGGGGGDAGSDTGIDASKFVFADMNDPKAASCVNNLKQIGLAMRIWSGDNGDKAAPNFISMKNELNNPVILHCPADTVTTAARDFNSLTSKNVSYRLLGPNLSDTYPGAVYVQCPVHGTVLLMDGSVQLGSADLMKHLKKVNGHIEMVP